MTLLIGLGALQGFGAALLFPVSVSVLTNAFPSVKASHAIGLAYGIAGLGIAAGPLIGGLLTDTVGWRWIFWLNVPLTLVSLAIAAWSVDESSDQTAPRRIDIAGLALIIAGIGLFKLTFDRAPHWGWPSAPAVVAFAGSLAALARSSSSRTACSGRWSSCRWFAGVGVAVSGTVLEILERGGTPTAAATDTILGVLAALLLAASAVVLWIARAATESARSH